MQIIWDPTPDGNVDHIDEHGVSIEEVEYVLENPDSHGVSRSSGAPCVFGYTPDDRYIIVIYEDLGDDMVMPKTAYDVPEPRGRS